MTLQQPINLTFKNGQNALATRVYRTAELHTAISSLGLDSKFPVLVVIDGSGGMTDFEVRFLRPAFVNPEIGWDEFQAQKYRAWGHHLALTALALWFVAKTKLEWTQSYERDTELAEQLAVEVLPALSTANVRELLKAALPLPQLTPHQAPSW